MPAAFAQMPPNTRRPAPNWLVPALLWSGAIVAALAMGQYAEPPNMGMPRGVPRMPGPPPNLRALLYQLGVGSTVWYAAILAAPLLVWGARRLDAERQGWRRIGAIVALALLSLVTLSAAVEYFVVYGALAVRPPFANYLPMALRQHLLPWIALAGIVAAIEARRRAVHAAIERERLRAQVAEQRLIALTGQLQPHVLFNTLQGISTLIHRDANAADEMLAKLSDLLRDLLRHRDSVLVPLGDELRYTRTYLEIAQLRFADRLTFAIDVPAELHGVAVPLFILQPLVENALAHGIGNRIRGGHIAVTARRAENRLHLDVIDDGAGLASGHGRDGIGLGNTRERLHASFGDDQRLTLSARETGGTIAHVDLPFRPRESA
jgi:hypothetical protein